MRDLPIQTALQQSHARPISGEELETFGKKAADTWSSGRVETLTEAVVETIKHAGLAPEQVKRVVEFANTSAYLHEFKKEGGAHKVIEFAGGPADSSMVLQDLNDGGGGTVFDRGTMDYHAPPQEGKMASDRSEAELVAALQRAEAPMLQHNPFGEVIELKEKLGSLYDNQTSVLSGLEGMYMDLHEALYGHVKQAALSGTTLGEVVQAWAPFVEDPAYIKAAFETIGPRLLQEGVYYTTEAMGESLEKVGQQSKMVNTEHPLVTTMVEFCETLDKLAGVRTSRDQTKAAFDETVKFLQNPKEEKTAFFFGKLASLTGTADQKEAAANPGAIKRLTDLFAGAGEHAGTAGRHAGEFLFGKDAPVARTLESGAKNLVTYAPHLAGAGVAVRGAQHLSAMGDTPTGHAVKSLIPGTPEFQQKNQELSLQYGGFPSYPGQY